jgi:hypothetical protein
MHEARSFVVVVPEDRKPLFRLIPNPPLGVDDYKSNSALDGEQRLWPEWGDDWVTYEGVSCFEFEWQARDLAKSVHARLARQERPRRWSAIQGFYVDGHDGQAYALDDPDDQGHHSAWGPAASLYSSGQTPVPIPP